MVWVMSFFSFGWSEPDVPSTACHRVRTMARTESTVADPFSDDDRRRLAVLLAKRFIPSALDQVLPHNCKQLRLLRTGEQGEKRISLASIQTIRELRKAKDFGPEAVAVMVGINVKSLI
jgi:hypothetical protein